MSNWKWKNFEPHEVLSPSGLEFYNKGTIKLQGFALDILEEFRNYFNLPIIVNKGQHQHRGFRSEAENLKIGGIPNSSHTQGIAFDCTPGEGDIVNFAVTALTWSWQKLQQKNKFTRNTELGFRGIGIYKKANFCHLDCRTILKPEIVVFNGHTLPGERRQISTAFDALILDRSITEVKEELIKRLSL